MCNTFTHVSFSCQIYIVSVSHVTIGTVDTPSLRERMKTMGGGDEQKVRNAARGHPSIKICFLCRVWRYSLNVKRWVAWLRLRR